MFYLLDFRRRFRRIKRREKEMIVDTARMHPKSFRVVGMDRALEVWRG